MNICFFLEDLNHCGGTLRATLNVAESLIEHTSHTIFILATVKVLPPYAFPIHPKIKILNLYDKPTSLCKNYFSTLWRERKLLVENKIDVIIDVDTLFSCFTIPATFGLKIKKVSWEHFHYHIRLSTFLRPLGRWFARYFANHIVTITQKDCENFRNAGSFADLRCIYNLIVPLNKTIAYKGNRKMILSVGRFAPQKGFDFIPQIAAPLFAKHPDWEWVIVGEGNDRVGIEAEIRKYHLEKYIKLVGKCDPTPYYLAATLFVMTSRFEGFGLVLTEAMQYHLPCVSFACDCGPDEIIMDGVSGSLVEVGNMEMMSQKIMDLMEHPQRCLDFSQNAETALKKFDNAEIVAQWERLLSN